MRAALRGGVLLAGLIGLGVLGWWLAGAWHAPSNPSPPTPARAPLAERLGAGADAGYARAFAPRAFSFPQDHGAHPDFKQEWWYFTGNLHTADGRRFGFELTFFRIALAPRPRGGDSAWATRQLYMAHFALSDIAGGEFHHFQRFSRGALGLAGARPAPQAPHTPFRVWLEDWQVRALPGPVPPRCTALGAPARCAVLQLSAAQEGLGVRLRLASGKPLVLQGDAGLSRKGAARGNASYYYSFPRLAATGTLRIGGQAFEVEGGAWMDHEWSTSALGPGQTGWDWFALQLDDGRELMYYRLRRADGTADPHSGGVLVDAQGRTRRLDAADVEIGVEDRWQSPHSDIQYPTRWRIRVKKAPAFTLRLRPLLADQELYRAAVPYWEGAVAVHGDAQGRGYVELAGYRRTAPALH